MVFDNYYPFANTKISEDLSRWHSLQRLIFTLNLKHPEKIKTITNHHRLSTIMASMELTQQELDNVYAITHGTFKNHKLGDLSRSSCSDGINSCRKASCGSR